VLSVCAPSASVVYAVSPMERSDVKSQNFPSVRENDMRTSATNQNRIFVELTLRLSNEPNPRRELLRRFRGCGYATDKREPEFRLPKKKRKPK